MTSKNRTIGTSRKLAHARLAYAGSPKLLRGQIRWNNPERNLLSRAAHEAAMGEAETEKEVVSFAQMAARAQELMF